MIELIVNRFVSCSLPTKSNPWSAPAPLSAQLPSELTLDGGRYALLLEAIDVLGSQLASQERVFGEGLKVPSSQRVSVHADSRREEDVGRPGLGLIGKVLADLVEDVLVPCCCE